ncbi:MAG TPA: hypothetical protein VE178_20540, partial [Silvibacterium sp.]|nr:hypothetical protein [Silvibacterium sp.]
MASNHPMQSNFGLLPEPQGRFGSFGVSLVINLSVGALLILFAAARIHQVRVQKENTAVLIFPIEPPKPYIPPVPKVRVIPPPPKVEPPKPKIQPPKPIIEPPKPVEVKIPT